MTWHSYTLSRTLFPDEESFTTSVSIADNDAVNCAHMLAAGFNTMSRNMLNGWVLAVVNTEDGRVFYDGTAEQIRRDKSSKYAHIARSVLEDTYAEMQAVKSVVEEVGVETIPLSSGVREMQYMIESRDEQIAEFAQERANRDAEKAKYESDKYMPLRWESFAKIDDALRDNDVTNNRLDEGVRELGRRLEHEYHARTTMEAQYGQANEAARAELIAHVKGAYGKWSRVDPGRTHSDLKSHLRGMIEVLSKYLVAIGEADADERHAVALRVCEIPEGTYLYDDA